MYRTREMAQSKAWLTHTEAWILSPAPTERVECSRVQLEVQHWEGGDSLRVWWSATAHTNHPAPDSVKDPVSKINVLVKVLWP